MSVQSIQGLRLTPSRVVDNPLSWGTVTRFRHLAKVDKTEPRDIASYWVHEVSRPAHRIAHEAPMPGCPGCTFEIALPVEQVAA